MNLNSLITKDLFVNKVCLATEALSEGISVSNSQQLYNEVGELKKRNRELQTMLMDVIANDKKRQEEFKKIINILKEKIKNEQSR